MIKGVHLDLGNLIYSTWTWAPLDKDDGLYTVHCSRPSCRRRTVFANGIVHNIHDVHVLKPRMLLSSSNCLEKKK